MEAAARLVTFATAGGTGYGLVDGESVVDLTDHLGAGFQSLREVIAAGRLAELVDAGRRRPADRALTELELRPPIPAPEKIICVGVNYPDRNAEYKDGQDAPLFPSLFVRFPGSFVGHGQPLVRPKASAQLDYEGELVLVIGTAGRHIAERDALDHVAGISIANEGSVRDWMRHGKFNVTQGKNFDRSGAIGPWLIPFTGEDQIADVAITTTVNGEVRQNDRTGRMIFGFRRLIAYISAFTTLVPGDVILTGTPTGAGARLDPPVWLKPGDTVEVEIERLGRLRNTVVDEA